MTAPGPQPTLAEFLLARYLETQRHAEALWVTMQSDSFTAPASIVNFGALVDPRKVLADLAAKKKIVELHAYAHHCDGGPEDTGWVHEFETCPTLRFLAQPYSDHSDFRAEWAL